MLDASWIVFTIASLVLIATPGQDMILVMSRSIAQGGAAGVVTAAGVSAGLVGHTVLATLGLGAILRTADWLFLLRQKPESIDRLGREGKLHVDEWMKRQLSSVSTEHGHYSEVFVHGPMGSGVGRLILDPFSMLLYSTRAEDYQAIKTLTDQGVPVAEAIETIIERRSGA